MVPEFAVRGVGGGNADGARLWRNGSAGAELLSTPYDEKKSCILERSSCASRSDVACWTREAVISVESDSSASRQSATIPFPVLVRAGVSRPRLSVRFSVEFSSCDRRLRSSEAAVLTSERVASPFLTLSVRFP